MKVSPKVALVFLFVFASLFVVFSSFVVHELVHFVQDGFANPVMCFFGYDVSSPSIFHLGGTYVFVDGSPSEFGAYLVQAVFFVVLYFPLSMFFWKVYNKL